MHAPFIRVPSDALVTMRRFSPKSLMWQTVFVRPDRTGVLTTLIGEISGAPQRSFRLSSGKFAELRRLVASARSVKTRPTGPGDYVYTLHIAGQPPEGLEGHIPKRLAPLVGYLSGMMRTYCC